MAITKNGSQPLAADVTSAGTATLTNKTINLSSNTLTGTLAEFNTALSGADFVSLAGSETLTNKTLTSPVLGGTTTTASGNLVVEPATFILEVKGGGATVGQIQLNCPVNSHGQKIASQPHAASATNTLTLPGGTTIGNGDAVLVSDTGIQTLTSKTVALGSNTISGTTAQFNTALTDGDFATLAGSETLTNKTLSGGSISEAVIKGLEEDVNVVASAATGTINFDVETASIWYYTSNASANHTLNFRFSSSVSLNTALATGDAITLVWLNTNGGTAYYPDVIQIDGTTVTPKVPAAISAGNASAIDAYSFTIIKTASATFTVLETQQKFA